MTILTHPATDACRLRNARLYWMTRAGEYWAKGDYSNARECRATASGYDGAIVILGGEGISLRITDYLPEGL